MLNNFVDEKIVKVDDTTGNTREESYMVLFIQTSRNTPVYTGDEAKQ